MLVLPAQGWMCCNHAHHPLASEPEFPCSAEKPLKGSQRQPLSQHNLISEHLTEQPCNVLFAVVFSSMGGIPQA